MKSADIVRTGFLAWAALAGTLAACNSTDAGQALDGSGTGGADGGGAEAGAAPDAGGREVWPDLPSAPEPEILAFRLASPCAIALGGDGVIVGEDGAGRVVTLPVTGLSPGAKPREIAPDLGGSGRLAVLGGDVFVSQRGVGRIVRVRSGAATTLATSQVNPARIRAAAGYVYWIVEGSMPDQGGVRRVPIEGGAVENVATMVPSPRDLAVATNRVYVTSGARMIASYPLGGGPAIDQIADKAGNTPYGLALDEVAGAIYWTAPGPKPGGFLRRANLALQSEAIVSITPPGAAWAVLDGDFVYWQNGQSLTRAPRGGGAYQDLVLETAACDLAVEGGAIVWSEPSTGRVYRHVVR